MNTKTNMNTTPHHTPSPWHIAWCKSGAHIYDQGTIAVVSDELIAWKANARLMAAAPELLAAARHLLPRARRAQRLSKADMLLLESVIAKAIQP